MPTKLHRFATKLVNTNIKYKDGLELLKLAGFKLIDGTGLNNIKAVDEETIGFCYGHHAIEISYDGVTDEIIVHFGFPAEYKAEIENEFELSNTERVKKLLLELSDAITEQADYRADSDGRELEISDIYEEIKNIKVEDVLNGLIRSGEKNA